MKYHYDVPGDDFSLAGAASTDLKRILARIGLSPNVIKRSAIAMYEAEINMVIHAGGGFIDVEIQADKIVIRLEDTGPGIPDLTLAMTEGFSTAPEYIRELGFGAGMGLPNIKRNCDDLHIDTVVGKGTVVTIMLLCKAKDGESV